VARTSGAGPRPAAPRLVSARAPAGVPAPPQQPATAWYLYCLAPSGRIGRIEAPGIDERPVTVLACGGVTTVLSEVPLDEFCGEAAEARLQDLAWLAPRVCRHEAVVEEAMRKGPILPARFAALYSSTASLEQFIACNRQAIAEFFSEIGGRQEWAVKGMLLREKARSALRATAPPALSASPGARYFEEKRIEAGLARQVSLWLKEVSAGAAAELEPLAAGFRERKVTDAGPDEDGTETVLNWAFLVAPEGIGEFRARVGQLSAAHAARGLSLRLSGPWPPYSFVPAFGEAQP
jgi:hypothetical protein